MEKEIINLLKSAGLCEVSFLYHWTKPVIQRDGIKYELMDVSWEDEQVYLSVIPSYTFQLQTMVMDNTWRKNSQKHIRNLVAAEVAKYNE